MARKRKPDYGLPPGTLVHVGEKRSESVSISVFDYTEQTLNECAPKSIQECFPFKESASVTWINVNGVHEMDIIETLGKQFDIHPLTMEDIANTRQRPKLEDFDRYLYLMLKMPYYDDDSKRIRAEQISIILTSNCVISFQEQPGDVFDPIRERLRNNKGRIRKAGTDYLAYSLADAIVDNCFGILETVGERVEDMEEHLVTNPTPETLKDIHDLKREMILLRKAMWPLREVISALSRGESALIEEPTRAYLRDVYDHTIQVIDTIETFRDMVSGMLDIYLSSVSNRMNEVMKVLTIIATIFIPLTFIAGVYGMNFEWMPELKCRAAYPILWLVMLAVAGTMVIYFRRKRWL